MKLQDLVDLVKLKPVVKFVGNVDDLECYPELGMHARIIGIDSTQEDLVKLTVDYSEFEQENKVLESSNYLDDKGNAVLNAAQAGYYSPQDKLYIDSKEGNVYCEQYFQVLNPVYNKLFSCYQDERNPGEIYSEWLQTQAEPLSPETNVDFSRASPTAFLEMNADHDNFNPLFRTGLSMIRRYRLESIRVTPLKDGQYIGVEGMTITSQSKMQELKDKIAELKWESSYETNLTVKSAREQLLSSCTFNG